MGMSQTGCCCGTKVGTCSTCEPEVAICCLQVEHSGWSADAAILLRPSASELWDTADTCPLDMVATEICGAMEDHWHKVWREEYCLPRISLRWKPIEGDCDRIALTLRMEWSSYIGETTIEGGRDWHTRDVVFDDPIYPDMVAAAPLLYPDEPLTVTIRVCPEGYTAFPDPDSEVVLQSVVQSLDVGSGDWSDYECSFSEAAPGIPLTGTACGNCVCSSEYPRYSHVRLTWRYDPYRDEIILSVVASFSCSYVFSLFYTGGRIPYEACTWPDSETFIYFPGASPEDEPTARVRIQRLDIECPDVTGEPVDPPPYCKKKSLCVLLSVDDGESYEYYTLVWNDSTDLYELAESSVPGGKPFTIEIILVEVGGPGTGTTRTWELTVIVRDSVTEDIVYEFTDEYVLNCEESWSLTAELEVPDEDPSWLLTIATECPDPPEPPECDPGCWPECVMCPTRKTLYAVVSDAPDCCLSGSYALTWVGTGGGGAPTVGYYELSAPVGGPIDTCGQITFLRVYCVDSTHITVQLVYLRAEGTEISNLSSPATLSVICDESGNLESDAINVPGRSGGRDSLCGFGSGVGGDIRIVST